ncbi:MAG: DnaJ domain-containing protein [Candidatus Eremiobacteraeota bacterium]|nr:DnaJ domain-containing protein [Candidatus Eremiobacteraeota bacterium]
MKDYYKTLGVAPTDSREKVQEVYRNISKKYRGAIKAELRDMSDRDMKLVIEAYNVINDEGKRKDYDAQPQFQVRKSAQKLIAASGKKDKDSDEKKPFKWGIPLMDIIMMSFRQGQGEKRNETPEEKAQMHFTQGVLMADDKSLYEQARNEFTFSLKFVPEFREAIYNVGLMNYKMGNFQEALNQFRKCLELESRDLHAKKMIELLE